MDIQKPPLKVAVAYLICTATWGTTWFAIRVCIDPGGYPAYEAASIRFSLAVILIAVLGVFGVVSLRQQTKNHVWWLAAAGLFNAVGYALVFAGEESVSGSVAAVLFASLPLVTAIVAVATRTEAISFAHILGAVVSFSGIAIIFWDRLRVSHEQAMGVVKILGAVVSSSGYALVFKRKTQDTHSMSATLIFLAATAGGLWCVPLVQRWKPLPWPLPLKPTLASHSAISEWKQV
ncbi:MAG: DMT family transporter [Acidobacteriota bacterium]|nr:DMT family transporter [Acidobacteriota bacterium]